MSKELLKTAGDIENELSNSTLDKIAGGVSHEVQPLKISKDNTGKYCTLTWECSICPTLTCFC